jgi:hypothetical protein
MPSCFSLFGMFALAAMAGCSTAHYSSPPCPTCSGQQTCISACADGGPTPVCVVTDSTGQYRLGAVDGGIVQDCPTF